MVEALRNMGACGQKHCSCIKVVPSDFQGQLSQINQHAQPRSSLYLWKSQLPHPFLPRQLLISKYNIERPQEWKGAECEDSKIRLHMQWQQWVWAVQITGKLNVRAGATSKPSKAQTASQQKQHSLTGSSGAQWAGQGNKTSQHFNWCNLTGTPVVTAAQHCAAILMGLFCWAEQWSLFLKTASECVCVSCAVRRSLWEPSVRGFCTQHHICCHWEREFERNHVWNLQ